MVELEVDEVGPSLRYATAKIAKTSRGGGGGGGGGGYGGGGGSWRRHGGGGQGADDPWATGPAGGGGGAAGGGSRRSPRSDRARSATRDQRDRITDDASIRSSTCRRGPLTIPGTGPGS